ncbi:sulfotransferase domain-containing protein [SAR92 clade bacterium H455]|uniref:Sulfotransferase domain-containing protein n=1 Tax=SAR92 clade bacterium H455 TaxID=2974818 RepID=A0ABY5TU93_9GAMM|nr:sulfotransferase domain-containing protein [SAR92 clade bacterium H455]
MNDQLASSVRPIFIIGVQKCMTTFCHNILADSVHVSALKRKELHYYDGYPNYSYCLPFEELFEVCDKTKYVLDSTPSYSVVPGALERIHHNHPNAIIVICTRDKLKRTISQYNHERRNGFIGNEDILSVIEKDRNRYDIRESYWDHVLGNYDLKNDYTALLTRCNLMFLSVIHLNFDYGIDVQVSKLSDALGITLRIPFGIEKNESVLPRFNVLARLGARFERLGWHKGFVLIKLLNRGRARPTKISDIDALTLSNLI